MDIFKIGAEETLLNKNLTEVSKMIQINNLNAKLVEQVVKTQIEKNKLNYQYPASVGLARTHANAYKFGFTPSSKGQPPEVCPCCYHSVHKSEIEFCYSTTSISDQVEIGIQQFKLSSSVSLYFSFIKMIIFYFFLRFLISDAFSLYANYKFGTNCLSATKSDCQQAIWNFASVLNLTGSEHYLFIEDILNLVTIVLSIIFFFIYRKQQYQFNESIDKNQQTEDDFTIFVSNIPLLDFPNAQEVRKMKKSAQYQLYHRLHLWDYFEDRIKAWRDTQENWKLKSGTNENDFHQLKEKNGGTLRSDDIVKSITLCYDLTRLEILQKNREQLIENQRKMIEHEKINDGQSLSDDDQNRFDTIPEQVSFLNDCEIVLNRQFANDNSILFNLTHFVGSAFISFQYQHYRQHILELYENQNLQYNGSALKIQRAADPSDVYWKNLKYSNSERNGDILCSYLILLMVLIFAFIFIGALQMLKLATQKSAPDPPNMMASIVMYSLVIFVVIIVMLVNKGLSSLIIYLTQGQKHPTRSNQVLSLVIKMVVSQFLNSAILYFVISRVLRDSFTSKVGLVLQITSFILISGFINIFYTLVYPSSLWRRLTLFCRYRNYSDTDTVNKFQKQLNKQFQFCQFDIAANYAFYIMMLLTVSFYAYLVPVIVPFIVIIFSLQFWVDKLTLFKRSSLKYNFDFFLTRMVLKIFESSIFVFAIGWNLFSFYSKNGVNIYNLIGLGIAALYCLFLVFGGKKMEKRFFGSYEFSETKTYDDCVSDGNFEATYWIKNPATYLVKESDVTGKCHILNPVLKKIFITAQDMIKQ